MITVIRALLVNLFLVISAPAQYSTHPAVPKLAIVPESEGFCRIKLVSADRSACFVFVSDLAPMDSWRKHYGPLQIGVAFTLRVPDGFDVQNAEAARMALRNSPWINRETVITPPWERK